MERTRVSTGFGLEIIRTNLHRVIDQGLHPDISPQDLLSCLDLSENQPDRKTLMSRLLGSDSKLSVFSNRKHINDTERYLFELTHELEEEDAPQEVLHMAANLAVVANRQIQREGDICSDTRHLALSLAIARDGLIDPEIAVQLAEAELEKNQKKQATFNDSELRVLIIHSYKRMGRTF